LAQIERRADSKAFDTAGQNGDQQGDNAMTTSNRSREGADFFMLDPVGYRQPDRMYMLSPEIQLKIRSWD
jgi:hypothetical protein